MTKRILFSLFLYSCGGVETAPTFETDGPGPAPVKVLPPVVCSCDDAGRTGFLPGGTNPNEPANVLVICTPLCAPAAEEQLGPNEPVCTDLNPHFKACVTAGCCHWMTPKELGL